MSLKKWEKKLGKLADRVSDSETRVKNANEAYVKLCSAEPPIPDVGSPTLEEEQNLYSGFSAHPDVIAFQQKTKDNMMELLKDLSLIHI